MEVVSWGFAAEQEWGQCVWLAPGECGQERESKSHHQSS